MLTAPPTNQNPIFADNATIRSVAENTPAGQNIGDPVAATHGDSKGRLVYSLSGTDDASFDIDTSTGQLKTKTIFDYETDTKTSYTVTISVSDGMDSYSNADTAEDDTIEVTIKVTDVNESPAFDDGLSVAETVAENTEADSRPSARAFTVTDPDSATRRNLLAGHDGDSTRPSPSSPHPASLRPRTALDFETQVCSYTRQNSRHRQQGP